MTDPAGSLVVPRLLVVTDRRSVSAGRTLCQVISAAVAGGASTVLLRERDLPDVDRRLLADEVLELLAPVGGLLIWAAPATPNAVGVHLRSTDPLPAERPRLLGRSVHTPAEASSSVECALDYVTVSPVAPSMTKPGYGPPLGCHGVGQTVAAAGPGLPVIALGGVDATNAGGFVTAGAHGVAVMGGLMRAADPAEQVAAILAGMAAAAGRPT